MIWHVLASVAVGFGAAAEPCIYLTLKRRRYFFLIWAVISALFFGYGFIPGLPAQVAYAVLAFAIGCALECACYIEVMSDRVYTAILQYVMSCLAIYLGERYVQAFLPAAEGLPAAATEHFVHTPEALVIIVAVNALWFAGMFSAYQTIMRYTPYPDEVYRRAIVATAPLIPLELFIAFGGDGLLLDAVPHLFLAAVLIASFITLSLLLGLSSCVSANTRYVVTTRLDLIESQNKTMKEYVDGIERYNTQLRMFRHDQRHFIDTLSALLGRSDLDGARRIVEELSERNESLSRQDYCTNGTINAMLLDAKARCDALGVAFDATLRMPDEVLVADGDLVALIKNMLENAVECCAGLERPRESHVSVKILCEGGILSVTCENSVDEAPRIFNDRIKTTKTDGNRMHGIGIESMHLVALKYAGSVTLEAQGGVFRVRAHLDNKALD